MAQVTMSGQEYVELMQVKDKYYKLINNLSQGVEVSYDAESTYRSVLVYLPKFIPQEVIDKITAQVFEQLLANPDTIKRLFEENRPMLNLKDGYFEGDWGHNKPYAVDIRTCEAINKYWSELKQKAHEEDEMEE